MSDNTGRLDLMGLTFDGLVTTMQRHYAKGAYHAAGLYRAFFRGRLSDPDSVRSIEEFSRSQELAQKVGQDLILEPPPVVDKVTEDDLIKFVTRLADGEKIESVIIPMERPMGRHRTLCISSQSGCNRGCLFCETGRLGFRRNLTAEEIVGQVYRAVALWGIDVKTVVFMGMGEPLDNLDNVIQAVRIISDQRGLNIAKRHITVSTVGIPRGLERLGALNWPGLNLAVSVNAPNDAVRSQIMPVNRTHSMGKVKQALMAYPLRKKGSFFIEYVLIEGVNDGVAHARELAGFLAPLRTKVNVIPFNPGTDAAFRRPTDDAVDRFCECLASEKVFVRRRRSKGVSVMAACGQLGAARA